MSAAYEAQASAALEQLGLTTALLHLDQVSQQAAAEDWSERGRSQTWKRAVTVRQNGLTISGAVRQKMLRAVEPGKARHKSGSLVRHQLRGNRGRSAAIRVHPATTD